jgi:fructose-1,6-bisphosphatase/inositol monophosphatase family enzyme
VDTADILSLMKAVAAEVIRPRFRALAAADIAEKGPGDFVTVADREAEVHLTAALAAAYPAAVIIGEEAVAAEPGRLAALDNADHAFVIDPVDGTRNFVAGNPDYAVMIGELHRGTTTRAWIWQPEYGIALVGESGAGVERNGVKVHPVLRGDQPHGVSTPRRLVGLTDPALAGPIGRSWSCCGVDYAKALDGRADFCCFGPPKPWDHIPGALLLSELGGVVRTVAGQEYAATTREGYLVVAASPDIWTIAQRVVQTKLASA